MSGEAIGFEKALKISKMVFAAYAEDFTKWGRAIDGTPIANDLSVRMAKAFSGLYTSPTMEDDKMKIETGGPAFPTEANSGMTLRDYFAAKALSAQLLSEEDNTLSREIIAYRAYEIADFMLKARERQS